MIHKYKGSLSNSSLISKLLLLIGISCLLTSVGAILCLAFTGGNISDTSSLKLLQLVQSVGMFVVPPFILAYLWSKKPIDDLHLSGSLKLRNMVIVIALMLILIPFINLLSDWNQHLTLPQSLAWVENWMKSSEMETAKVTEQLLNVHHLSGLILNIFLISILPALGEELFFRGSVQSIFSYSFGTKSAIWITAILFSAIHLQFYGFLPRMLLGAFFGYLLLWSDSLWLPILAHFTNNVIAVIFYYLKNNGVQVIDIDNVGTGNTLWMGCASGVIASLGIYYFYKSLRKTVY